MNAPQLIIPENVMVEKPIRLKGCRYHLLYSGHLSKEIYYNWFRQNLMPRRDAQVALFIANITISGAQFTKVIFKFNVTIDWKSIEKLDFPIGTGKSRPEVRPIYKSSWSTEYMNMVKQDPNTYPPLNDVNIISARSPKRVKGVSIVPTPIVPPVAVPTIEPIREISLPSVIESPESSPPVEKPTDFKEKIQDVISEMGIMDKLSSLEQLIRSLAHQTISSEPLKKPNLLPQAEDSRETPVRDIVVSYGVFIEGDASDLVLSTEMPNILLENKSVIAIRPITNETKNAIHTTKNSMEKCLDILKTHGVWFRKYQDKIVMKNTDLMLMTLYIII